MRYDFEWNKINYKYNPSIILKPIRYNYDIEGHSMTISFESNIEFKIVVEAINHTEQISMIGTHKLRLDYSNGESDFLMLYNTGCVTFDLNERMSPREIKQKIIYLIKSNEKSELSDIIIRILFDKNRQLTPIDRFIEYCLDA